MKISHNRQPRKDCLTDCEFTKDKDRYQRDGREEDIETEIIISGLR